MFDCSTKFIKCGLPLVESVSLLLLLEEELQRDEAVLLLRLETQGLLLRLDTPGLLLRRDEAGLLLRRESLDTDEDLDLTVYVEDADSDLLSSDSPPLS